MTDQEKTFVEQRKRNRVAYTIEDFYDSIIDLNKLWLSHIGLGGLLALSLVFGADNRFHFLCSLLTAVFGYAIQHYVGLLRLPVLLLVTGAYLAGVTLEFLIGGLPDTLIHALSLEQGWRGTLPMLNAFTPYIYLFARLSLVYFFVNIMLKQQVLARQPIAILRQLDREVAGYME